jgi:hypothetical protein
MTIHWESLFAVVVTSLGATVAVVALVALALVGLSARAPRAVGSGPATSPARLGPTTGAALAGICLTAAAAIVLLGLWAIVSR